MTVTLIDVVEQSSMSKTVTADSAEDARLLEQVAAEHANCRTDFEALVGRRATPVGQLLEPTSL